MFKQAVYNIAYYLSRDKLVLGLIILFFILAIMSPGFLYRVPGYIDYNTLSFIVFYLLISKSLVISGLTDNFAIKMIAVARGNKRRLTTVVLLSAFLLSAIVTNDGAVLILVPLVLSLAGVLKVDPSSLVIIVLLAANTGSILMPFGNPQNIIIWQHYGISIADLTAVAAPLSFTGLLVLVIYSYFFLPGGVYVTSISGLPKIRVRKLLGMVSLALLVAGVVLGEFHQGVYALILGILLFLLVDRYVLRAIDVGLVLSFLLMFPDFRELAYLLSGFNIASASSISLYSAAIVLSQFISNVPATIALIHFTTDWKTLLIGVNIAGYVTPLGSMANIIGLRLSGVSGTRYISKTMLYSFVMIIIGLLFIILLKQ